MKVKYLYSSVPGRGYGGSVVQRSGHLLKAASSVVVHDNFRALYRKPHLAP
ncbi:hypothetical protein E2C01_082267 [Portunus trituberculatus]|uniref:Uncharacterized protein n=1 Tax=Portunus trituberculatus TaxID=210409 RepID=A0A5B7J0C8_PORTR|nr:hypothetical protein [Portunus trituberculatus]